MENAVEALKMAGSVLLFVIALSVAILAFTQSREAIDAVLKYSDRESLMIENDSRFYYLKSNDTQRYVGKETIIPTIYRVYHENYKIVFKFQNGQYLYKKMVGTTGSEEICTIDSANENFGNNENNKEFLDVIVYGKYKSSVNPNIYNLSHGIRNLPTHSLFDYLDGKKVIEKLGTYYIEDLKKDASDTGTKSSIEDVNKNEKRVITYTISN